MTLARSPEDALRAAKAKYGADFAWTVRPSGTYIVILARKARRRVDRPQSAAVVLDSVDERRAFCCALSLTSGFNLGA